MAASNPAPTAGPLLEAGARQASAPMAPGHGMLYELTLASANMDLDLLIQCMPPGIREKILSDLIALNVKNKATLKLVVSHRNIRGWAKVHDELICTVVLFDLDEYAEEDDAFDRAVEAAMDACEDAKLDRAFEESVQRGEQHPVCGFCHRDMFWGCDC